MRRWPLLAVVAAAVSLFPIGARAQEEIATIFAIPTQTLTFSAQFVAHDTGFFKKDGLKVTDKNLVGSPNAVLAGSADFTMGTGPIFLRAASQGQKFKAIVNLVDEPLVELVLRKDVAAAAGITAPTPLRERAKALKGRTIAIDGVGSIVHPWERRPGAAAVRLRPGLLAPGLLQGEARSVRACGASLHRCRENDLGEA